MMSAASSVTVTENWLWTSDWRLQLYSIWKCTLPQYEVTCFWRHHLYQCEHSPDICVGRNASLHSSCSLKSMSRTGVVSHSVKLKVMCFLVSLVLQISCIGFTVMFLSSFPSLRFFYFSKPNIYLQFATLLTNVRYFSSLILGLEKGIHRSFVWHFCHEISSRIQRIFRSQWYGMVNISSEIFCFPLS